MIVRTIFLAQSFFSLDDVGEVDQFVLGLDVEFLLVYFLLIEDMNWILLSHKPSVKYQKCLFIKSYRRAFMVIE